MDDVELKPETKEYLSTFFKRKDDGDGLLDARELEKSLHIVGLSPTKENIEFLFESFGEGKESKGSKGKNRKVKIEDIIKNIDVLIEQSVTPGKSLLSAFQVFDKNRDGFIRLPELLKVLMLNGHMEVDEARSLLTDLVKKFDANGDGKFDYNEFTEMMKKNQYEVLEQIVAEK